MTEDITTCANMNLRKAARLVGQFYDQRLQPSGLRATQFTLLVAIERMGPISISVLADKMGLDRTTLTRNVRLLEREKLVEIFEGEDARVRVLALTERGESLVAETIPYWEEAQVEFLNRIGRQRWERLLTELNSLSKNIASG